jgi:hypothetical protein
LTIGALDTRLSLSTNGTSLSAPNINAEPDHQKLEGSSKSNENQEYFDDAVSTNMAGFIHTLSRSYNPRCNANVGPKSTAAGRPGCDAAGDPGIT